MRSLKNWKNWFFFEFFLHCLELFRKCFGMSRNIFWCFLSDVRMENWEKLKNLKIFDKFSRRYRIKLDLFQDVYEQFLVILEMQKFKLLTFFGHIYTILIPFLDTWRALQVLPAETRLTVYRRRPVSWLQQLSSPSFE